MRDDNKDISMRDMRQAKAKREQAIHEGRSADAKYWTETVVLIWRSMRVNGYIGDYL